MKQENDYYLKNSYIILNIINNDDITYVTQRYSTNETIKHVNEHDVKELVRNEIYDIEEKRRMMK